MSFVNSVVLLGGRARAGKGSISKLFVQKYGFEEIPFAYLIKLMFVMVYGLPATKEEKYRPFLQTVGTDFLRKFDPNFHVRGTVMEMKRRAIARWPYDSLNFIVPDMRFPNEGNYQWQGPDFAGAPGATILPAFPAIFKEVFGFLPDHLVSVKILVSEDVQRHAMGNGFEKFDRNHESEIYVDDMTTDLTYHNREVGIFQDVVRHVESDLVHILGL